MLVISLIVFVNDSYMKNFSLKVYFIISELVFNHDEGLKYV